MEPLSVLHCLESAVQDLAVQKFKVTWQSRRLLELQPLLTALEG